jgi:hypothetical protein
MIYDKHIARHELDSSALFGRALVQSGKSPSEIGRLDLMTLMGLAGLSDTKAYLQLVLGRRDTVTISANILRCMIRLASADDTHSGRVHPRLGRGQHRTKTTSAPLVEERLVEDESGALKWEVRLTARGIAERRKATNANVDWSTSYSPPSSGSAL